MELTTATVIAIALAAVVIIGAVLYAAEKRRSRELRSKFGPEYERAIEGRGRRAAERELAEREHRANQLRLRRLDPAERAGFAQSWAAVQRRFVDDPSTAVDEAHRLLIDVMGRRGYPTGRFEEEVALLSVHHPGSLQHYRAAHALATEGGANGTEEQRQALIHYRALFEDLLDSREGQSVTDQFAGVVAPAPAQAPAAPATAVDPPRRAGAGR